MGNNSSGSPAWICSGCKAGGAFSDGNSYIPSIGETGGAGSVRVDAHDMSSTSQDSNHCMMVCIGKA